MNRLAILLGIFLAATLPQYANADVGSIGDFVFLDLNGDGIQDAGEPGIDNVTVNLLESTGNTQLDTMVTDVNGAYDFVDLDAGDYIVEFVAPAGLVFTMQDQGGDDTVDSDADGTTGRTAPITLGVDALNITVDAGMLQLGVLGGRTFHDLNINNTEDAGEPPLSGVDIELFLDVDNGVLDDNVDTFVEMQTTDGDGLYQFVDLAPGTYFVREIVPPGFMQTAPISDFYTVTVESATNETNLNFGNVSFDFGDAPDPMYPTLLASNGARHVIVPGFSLGTDVDPDFDGQPNAMALGDDEDGNDDEDGVTFMSLLITCEIATVHVVASDTGRLNAWVDFDGNGSWADAGEQIFVNEPVSAGVNPLSFAVPCTATPTSLTFARFRLTTAPGIGIDDLADDGEVEDYELEIKGLDFGDAPDPGYPTVLSQNGARHVVGMGPHLGVDVDTEPNGLASLAADGDDLDGVDDEDGVVFTSILGTGQMATVEVTASAPGVLNAWIDFNDNGSWADVDEQVFVDVPVTAGVNALDFLVPADAAITASTFARFRINTTGGLLFGGLADDGEVEDHEVEIREFECLLDPPNDVNPMSDDHTVTLTLLLGATPVVGSGVEFEVTDGPNVGETVMGTTDVDGRASFTYNGAGGPGTDTIVARGTAIVDGKAMHFTCTATSTWAVRVLSLEPTPGVLINRAGGVEVIKAIVSQPVTVLDIRIEGARQGNVTRGSLVLSGTDTLTFVADPPLTVADRYTVLFLTDQGPIRWQFAVLVGDKDFNGVVNIFDLAALVRSLKAAVFNEACDFVEDGVINIFDLAVLRLSLRAGISIEPFDENDTDNDGTSDGTDNCPLVANRDQNDNDDDGLGDSCDDDDDNDAVPDGADNCQFDSNSSQVDTDSDGEGDACDSDDDNDSVLDGDDNCPRDVNTNQNDTDGDGVGDVCDIDADNDGIPDPNDPDDDNDGVADIDDPSPFDPDICGDSDGDTCDDCSVGTDDRGPLPDNKPNDDGTDTDGDGICDDGDDDDDNDGVDDIADSSRLDPTVCRDLDSDTCDDCSVGTDGFGPMNDAMPANDGTDTDSDGICDAMDADDDNDGVDDVDDPSPFDPDICGDSDNDTCDDCSVGTDNFGMLSDSQPDNDGPDADSDGTCDAGEI